MAKTKEIQRRIKSVKSTKKITKAMEMVAASKMRKAVDAVLQTRTYANLSWATVFNLAQSANNNGQLHPLLTKRDQIKKVGVILITSNRGLCGGFNSAIINKVSASVKKHHTGKNAAAIDFILVGKKGSAIYNHGYEIIAEFNKLDLTTEASEIIPVAQFVIKEYLQGNYDKIMVAYTDFINPAKQIPRVKQLLPIDIEAEKELGILGADPRVGASKEYLEVKQENYLSDEKFVYEYKFEPSPEEVLNEMIPRLIEVQLFQALLESNASEHSARMTAMHQATEAAQDMVDELTLFYNKARQSSITSEIAEISAGASALK